MAGSGIPASRVSPQRKYQRMLRSPLFGQGEGSFAFVLIKIFTFFHRLCILKILYNSSLIGERKEQELASGFAFWEVEVPAIQSWSVQIRPRC